MRVALMLIWLLTIAVSCAAQTREGFVVDTRNDVIPDAEVITSRNGEILSRTRSDSTGKFLIPVSTADARVLLRITAKDFAPFEKPVSEIVWPLLAILQPIPVDAGVVITITRSTSELVETPASIVVLEREELDSTAAQTIDDTLRQVAGFTLFRRSSSRTSNPTTQGANLRGVGGSGASRTSVLFDGLPLNDAFGGWTFWSRVPRVAVDQIEVMRGGASSIYGSSALSGAIGLSSSRVRKNAFRFEGSAGSQGTVDGSLFGALAKDKWFGTVATELFQTQGYIPVSREQRGMVDTQANSRHHSGLATVERRFGARGRIFGRGQIFAERRDNGTSLTNNRTYFRQLSGGGDVTGKLGTFEVRGSIDSQVYDQTFSAVSANRNAESLTRVQRVPSRSALVSGFWSRSFDQHSVSAQIDSRYVRGFSEEVGVNNGLPNAVSLSGGKELTFGLFLQDLWSATPKLNISFGARFDSWRDYDGVSRNRSLTTNQVTETFFPNRTENSLSPRLAAIYSVTNAVSVYGSYSHSFRAPSLNELYRAFRVGNVLTLANENLRAEKARTIEGGVSIVAYSRRVGARASVFHTSVEDPVVSVTLSSTPALITRRRENVGETRTRGLEAETQLSISDELRFTFGYLLNDSRIVDAGANQALVGKFLPQVARQQFTARALYRPAKPLTLSVQARASDAQFDDDLNTFRLRPYFTIDAYSSYRFQKWVEIFIAIENVFNSGYDIGLTPVRTVAGPRYVRGGLRFDLNRKS
ncbi:MAG TPA: TonB-dependent receptor [Pyrinomonadaceae bacterium]|nr:TonB-dependent receptor [Pyrinomonadaceae bacterium]